MSSSLKRREIFLTEMGVGPLWTRRDVMPDPIGALPQSELQTVADIFEPEHADFRPSGVADALATAPSADEIAKMGWVQLKAAVAGCVKCGLCQNRTRTVFGTGDEKAKWLFIGEGPGRNEDLQGEPFIGPAGKLLDNMLLAMGLQRGENAYIANIVKCRPVGPDGRDRAPTPDEAAACRPYLERQIALLQPSILVALGKTAGISLLGIDPETPVAQMRGKVHRFKGLPLVVTYHPAYLLRKLTDKAKTWNDLCLAMDAFAGNQ